eukprot:TRINITY_DN1733_c0_g1_i3.p1 TRINITY_DN1733_c0_g1~~TRINITY_DN1733_c0_g1_i3.p1  ORF type:complete len:546 (-),score=122.56 TRINITY_DN1733_c0_g1_i3:8-1546(-)
MKLPICIIPWRWPHGEVCQPMLPSDVRTHLNHFLVSSPAERFRPRLPTMATPKLPVDLTARRRLSRDEPKSDAAEAIDVDTIRQISHISPVVATGRFGLSACYSLLSAGATLALSASDLAIIKNLPRDRVLAFFSIPNDEADVEELVMSVAPYVSGVWVHRAHAATAQVPPSDFFVAQLKHVCRLAFGDRTPLLILSGGISTVEQVVKLHRAGVHASAQSAVASTPNFVARSVFECARAAGERADGLVPTVLVNESGQPLSLVFSSLETLAQGMESGKATYLTSERHGQHLLELVSVRVDIGQRFIKMVVRGDAVRSNSGTAFCEVGQHDSCFGPLPMSLGRVMRDMQVVGTHLCGAHPKAAADPEAELAAQASERVQALARAASPSAAAAAAASLVLSVLRRAAALGVASVDVARNLTLLTATRNLVVAGDAQAAAIAQAHSEELWADAGRRASADASEAVAVLAARLHLGEESSETTEIGAAWGAERREEGEADSREAKRTRRMSLQEMY